MKYYTLMIRYWTNEKNFLEIAKAYQAIYETPSVKADEAKWKQNLKLLALYLVLATYNNEQSDFINRVYLDKNLEEVPVFRNLLKQFLTKELMVWPRIQALYQPELSALPPFAAADSAQMLWQALQQRVTEHVRGPAVCLFACLQMLIYSIEHSRCGRLLLEHHDGSPRAAADTEQGGGGEEPLRHGGEQERVCQDRSASGPRDVHRAQGPDGLAQRVVARHQ